MVKLLPVPADTPAKEQRPVLAELPLRHRITDDGLDRLRDACAGGDRRWLLLRYLEFMADKPAPKNADASLVVWGRKFTKGKPPAESKGMSEKTPPAASCYSDRPRC